MSSEPKLIKNEILSGERALYGTTGARIEDTVFLDGESPLKESSDLSLNGVMFKWKYPLWYCHNVRVENSTWFEMARAGVWYTDHISVEKCAIEAPKNFRRCRDLSLTHVSLPNAQETLWSCEDVRLQDVVAKGDYFSMNCSGVDVSGLTLYGNYSFDGDSKVTVRDSRLLSKDAFWNCRDVTVYDSFISGEYLGWNSENLTFVNCTIESLQGLCYIGNLKMVNCRLLNTTLAFEYSSVDAEIASGIESVFNPKSGTIQAESIGELIVEKDKVNPSATHIVCRNIAKESDRPEWIKG